MVLNLDEKQVSIKTVEQTLDHGVFTVGPLPPGFGHTLGNTLRRVLLSSLKGAAISQVKFSGVPHQFTTISGVREDVVDLTLNLKQVRLKIEGEQPVALSILRKGPGEVTAGDIEVPAGVSIANPNLHLATLADKKTVLEAELMAEPGHGYAPAEEGEAKVGVIPLDRVFSPVRNVAYQVEPTRVGQVSDYDQLILDITTDRTIKPLEALMEASGILARFLARLELGEKAKKAPSPKAKTARQVNVEDLEIPLRTLNCLKKAKISSGRKLAEMEDKEILAIKNIGEKALKDIVRALKKEGLR